MWKTEVFVALWFSVNILSLFRSSVGLLCPPSGYADLNIFNELAVLDFFPACYTGHLVVLASFLFCFFRRFVCEHLKLHCCFHHALG